MSAPLYSPADLAYFRENYGETEFLVHVIGPDTVLRFSDDARTIPFTEETARKTADAYNAFGKRERELSEFAPHIHATVFHHGVPVEADTTVTGVRKALIAESYEHLAAIKQLKDKRRAGETLTAAELNLVDAHAKVNAYSYLMAGLLRIVEDGWGAAEGAQMAYLIGTVMDVGNEVLEDANDDLDEQVRGAVASA